MTPQHQPLRDRLKKYLDKLYAYDQAGGYVPLELADEDFNSLCNFVEALLAQQDRESRIEELRMLAEGNKHSNYSKSEYELLITDRLTQLQTNKEQEGSEDV